MEYQFERNGQRRKSIDEEGEQCQVEEQGFWAGGNRPYSETFRETPGISCATKAQSSRERCGYGGRRCCDGRRVVPATEIKQIKQTEAMEVDSKKASSKSGKGEIKRRVSKRRSAIVFPKYNERSKVKKTKGKK